MVLRAQRLGADNPEICSLRGMTPRKGWTGQTCTLYPVASEPPAATAIAAAFTRAMAEEGTVQVHGAEEDRSVTSEVRIVGVDPAGVWVSGVFVSDTVTVD
jgi:hypothetical protein